MASPPRRLAVDFLPSPETGTSRNHRQLVLQRVARIGSGEGFRLAIDRPAAVELFEASGWVVTEQMGLREAARTLLPPESGLPVVAVNDHKTLLAGHRS